MREAHRVFIVGDSLFAETLAQMLASSGAVTVVGSAPTAQQALSSLQLLALDAVLVVSPATVGEATLNPLLAAYPGVPIIRADLNEDYVQVITSQRIGAQRADVLAAILALPHRR
jgi:DNA-binding NarL/FixJ family response regulator